MTLADQILAELRVPDLPYPVGDREKQSAPDWTLQLAHQWRDQADQSVIDMLKEGQETWSMRQVNAAYLADRTMDVFLLKSGLHPALASRIARLRFWLAWQLEAQGAEVLAEGSAIRRWLDSIGELRGWSDSGGRSDKRVLERLDSFTESVSQTFASNSLTALDQFVSTWCEEIETQRARISKLRQRLMETERGAARQRAAEQRVRAVVGRALDGRKLAAPVLDFVERYWQGLMRKVILDQGWDSETWRHASRLFEWLVWVGDPKLSDQDRDRLYRVGEQLTDKLAEVWQSVQGAAIAEDATAGLQQFLVTRLRGEPVELALAQVPEYDPAWLDAGQDGALDSVEVENWYVEGEGADQQRRYLFAVLPESGEVLWTNGAGVKQGVEVAATCKKKLDSGELRPLPPLNPFANVLGDTLAGLSKVVEAQRRQRAEAVEKARAEARALREAQEKARLEAEAREQAEAQARAEAEAQARREAEEKLRQQAEARAKAEAEQQAAEAAAREREAVEAAEAAAQASAQRQAEAREQADSLRLGGWLELVENGEKLRLKLAVRINASGKLILVDRLGLNRRELSRQALIDQLINGTARILSDGKEFNETLSRVVGRIRGGQ